MRGSWWCLMLLTKACKHLQVIEMVRRRRRAEATAAKRKK